MCSVRVSVLLQGARASYFDSLDTGEEVDEKKFTYAWTLIHQKNKEDMRAGIAVCVSLFTLDSRRACACEF